MSKVRKLKTLVPSRRWRQLLNDKGFTRRYPFANPKLEPTKKLLLAIGGWAVCLPYIDEDYNRILERGKRFPGRSQMFLGQPSQCHSNCADLWDQNKDKVQICTGYALSKDGVWRQHSWCYDFETKRVLETTVKRIQYFGFILTDVEADEFFWNNL